jgi:hypothetical protein
MESAKHVVIAAIVIVTSPWLGTWIAANFGSG